MPSLKLITLNIEGDKHLDRNLPFFQKESPDVLCLQEVLEKDVSTIKNALGMEGEFFPLLYINEENGSGFPPGNAWGILILTKAIDYTMTAKFYAKIPGKELPNFGYMNPNACHRGILALETTIDGIFFRIITTHFTWTPDGEASDLQREHLSSLTQILKEFTEFVLVGDFNAPRGKEIWNKLAILYKDNLPLPETSTLDSTLHRVHGIQLVVDGIFSTPEYILSNVHTVEGVSDHKAIVAMIRK